MKLKFKIFSILGGVLLLAIVCMYFYFGTIVVLTVQVVDTESIPIENASISVTSLNNINPWECNPSNELSIYTTKTDKNGIGVIKFRCITGWFDLDVTSDNCYPFIPLEIELENFTTATTPIPIPTKCFGDEIFKEIKLFRKKNPQQMYGYSTFGINKKAPYWNGRFGFDLQRFDWLPPLGNGVVADFYYVRDMQEGSLQMGETNKVLRKNYFHFPVGEKNYPTNGCVVGRIEFLENGGAYIRKKTGNKFFQSTYEADLTAEYITSIPIVFSSPEYNNAFLRQMPILEEDEYMVVRSRVKCDNEGNIVSANYSKILGYFDFGFKIRAGSVIFNPRINDTNLEFDPNQNLYQGDVGRSNTP